jgi:pyridoxine kinase
MTSSPIKKVAAIHDLSCIGRCSLTVILPILSCLGIQVCPLPTAVLSSHPGGFTNVSVYDFAQHIPDFSAHWRREGIEFDAIYSGFLASERQISLVAQFIDDFSTNHPLILVDPVMGDDGHLYSICTDATKAQIRALVQKADIITPNYTEACFLLDELGKARFPQWMPFNPGCADWLQWGRRKSSSPVFPCPAIRSPTWDLTVRRGKSGHLSTIIFQPNIREPATLSPAFCWENC